MSEDVYRKALERIEDECCYCPADVTGGQHAPDCPAGIAERAIDTVEERKPLEVKQPSNAADCKATEDEIKGMSARDIARHFPWLRGHTVYGMDIPE